MTTITLIVAAGTGSRTGLGFPKQYLPLNDKTILALSTDIFLDHPAIDHVQVIINPEDEDLYKTAIAERNLLPWVAGGETRQKSVANGLEAAQAYSPDYVLIHDAARPFASADLIDRCLEALEDYEAVLPALSIQDTLKSLMGDKITGTLDRDKIVAAQTPQCFHFASILAAHKTFAGIAVTDDIALAERANIPVKRIEGDPANLKITTAQDIEKMTSKSLTDVRTGFGFDVHAFEINTPLWLGGVEIPYEKGLKGHSDADVALHALTDALLGAVGEGDIGLHFPPSDTQWKGASSDQFLVHAAKLVEKRGGKISNIDVTIICEAPKIGPYRNDMRQRIASLLKVSPDRVSVKGTTTEKLGFTGRQEGIAAKAVATVRLPE